MKFLLRGGAVPALVCGVLLTTWACGSGGKPASSAPERRCVAEVRRTTESAPAGSIAEAVDAFVVASVTDQGCAPLEGPLVAFNWFSFADRPLFEQTFEPVVQILARRGHEPVMYAATRRVLEAPEGTPRFGGAFVHEAFLVPVYRSAGSFLDMLVSAEFQEHIAKQQAGARREDYIQGFQRCVVGCPFGLRYPIEDGLFVLHVFDRPARGFDAAVARLQQSLPAGELFYAGETVAVLEAEIGEQRVRPSVRPWGNGTTVYRVDSVADAEALFHSSALREFRRDTTHDVIVVVEPDF